MLIAHDRRTARHLVPPGFPECPRRLASLLAGLEQDSRFEVHDATDRLAEASVREAAVSLHDPEYLARLERAVARGDGLIDSADNPLSPGTFAAALGALNGVLVALGHCLEAGEPVFAAVRPPGHHAERDHAQGFCYLNQAAIAAEQALRRGLDRVAVVDIDVHHGNGTQHFFEDRSDVLYASLHQYPFYPGTGAADERGSGAGEGFTVNAPLVAGGGNEAWWKALDEVILPAVETFAPDLLVVSAGFDAWRGDPLGGMRVDEEGFAGMGRRLFELAGRRCAGRALAVLEGGYDVEALPRLAAAFLTGSGS